MSDATPPGRKVVVVREGPPKKRGVFVDGVIGVLGVALLVMAGVLGETLPEEDVIPVQFLPEFPTNSTVAPLRPEGSDSAGEESVANVYMLEGEERRYDVLIAHDNVVSISMQVVIPVPEGTRYPAGDDIPSSLPDSFSVELFDPDGNPVGEVFKINSAQPRQNPEAVPTIPLEPEHVGAPLYLSDEVVAATSWRLDAAPEADFISGEDGTDRTMALSMAIDQYTIPTNGTWTLVVKHTNAGDCPPAGPSTAPERYAECQRETNNTGVDPGNMVTVKFVRYDHYIIEIAE